MIVRETLIINNKQFIKTYSDQNKYVKQVETGRVYKTAIDVLPIRYTYIESDKEIEKVE